MKKTAFVLTAIFALLALITTGIQLEMANANFFPGDALIIYTPVSKWVYSNTSIPLTIVASVENPTPEVVNITYCLNDYSNVTITNLNKTLNEPGHIDGSQFYAELVLTNLSEGIHNLEAYSKDFIGRQMSASVEFIIDTSYTSPLSVISPKNTTYTVSEIPLTFICREDRKNDGRFLRAVYVLNGGGSDAIHDNSTLADLTIGEHATDLPVGNHTLDVIVWTENGFFSETINFTISNPNTSPSPTPSLEPSISTTPDTVPYQEPFPTVPVVAFVASAIVVAVGLVICFRKRKSEAEP